MLTWEYRIDPISIAAEASADFSCPALNKKGMDEWELV